MQNAAYKLARRLTGPMWILALLAGGAFAWSYYAILQEDAFGRADAAARAWPAPAPAETEAWRVFQSGEASSAPAERGPLRSRFRLAGTFMALGEDAASVYRKAILDDLRQKRQMLVSEEDTIGSIEVRRIYHNRIILADNGREEELLLSFSGEASAPASSTNRPPEQKAEKALEYGRFGKRVGENRWVFQREAIMDYYREMLDHPERAVLLYESLKPDYNENRQIEGYVLDVAGEGDFFKEIGMREGDVVRKVNSMRMVSQNRAEYFISEFAKDRLSAVVMDIERDGKPEKLIYMIR